MDNFATCGWRTVLGLFGALMVLLAPVLARAATCFVLHCDGDGGLNNFGGTQTGCGTVCTEEQRSHSLFFRCIFPFHRA